LLRGVPEPGFYVEARPSRPSVERPESRAPVAGVLAQRMAEEYGSEPADRQRNVIHDIPVFIGRVSHSHLLPCYPWTTPNKHTIWWRDRWGEAWRPHSSTSPACAQQRHHRLSMAKSGARFSWIYHIHLLHPKR
jgi:hypothetical protein